MQMLFLCSIVIVCCNTKTKLLISSLNMRYISGVVKNFILTICNLFISSSDKIQNYIWGNDTRTHDQILIVLLTQSYQYYTALQYLD